MMDFTDEELAVVVKALRLANDRWGSINFVGAVFGKSDDLKVKEFTSLAKQSHEIANKVEAYLITKKDKDHGS